MKKNTIYLVAIALVAGLAGGYYLSNSSQLNQKNDNAIVATRDNCLADECLSIDELKYPVSELSKVVIAAIEKAIDDEYKALSVYESVIKKFGSVRPFSMIKGAEEQHIASLKNLFDKYGLKVPVNTWTNKIAIPATLHESCQTGVDAEIANAALYSDELLPAVTEYEDITLVFTNLMNASEQKHHPAFERCN